MKVAEMTSIRVEQLTKLYGDTTAVDHVSLEVGAGELFFLVGPSGCGKTTLLRMVAGFVEPSAGRIYLGDRDVTSVRPQERNTGMVFQNYALWPHMTVAQNVGFGLEIRKIRRLKREERIGEALEIVRMAKYAKRKPNELSGGQQQRVALARALAFRPKCLLLDEPLSNLDAKLRLEMRSEIKRICKSTGVTGLYVTHDQKEALSMADRVAVMDAGKIVQIGPPRKIYRQPGSRFVADFLGESNFLGATVRDAVGYRATLDTPLGVMVRDAEDDDVRNGESVTMSLRPEAIHVGTDGQGMANSFDGVVEESIYLGEVAQHRIRVGTEVLKVYELNPSVELEVGSKAAVWIDPAEVVLLTGASK